ncbi:MAG: TRAP transporter substrate-binding protein DctP [Betaproteobacteria bacterium]
MRLLLPRHWRVALWIALALLPPCPVAAHGVSLDVHHALAADSFFQREFLMPWIAKVEQESGGRIRFHLHPASTLGATAQALYEQVRDGGADLAWTRVVATRDNFPRLSLFDYPFLVRHAEGASRAVSEYVRVNDIAERDFDGVRLLAVHVGDGAQLHWGSAHATPPADVKGRRVVADAPIDGALLVALGATLVEMPLTQVASAMSEGSVDGALLPWARANGLGIARAAHAHVEFGPDAAGLTSSVFVFAMNPASYRALADDLRAVIDANSGIETAAWLGRVLAEDAAAARKAAAARGDAIRVATPEERERWQQAARAVTDAATSALEQGGVRIQPLLDSAREQLQTFDAAK